MKNVKFSIEFEEKLEEKRSNVRPQITKFLIFVWSIATLFLIVYSSITGTQIDPGMSYDYLSWITAGATVWYYGDRTFFKTKGAFKK